MNKGIGGGRKGEERNIGDADNIFPDFGVAQTKTGKDLNFPLNVLIVSS